MSASTTASPARPMLLAWGDPATEERLEAMMAAGRVVELVDAFTPSLAELFAIDHPNLLGSADNVLEGYVARRRAELEPSSVVAVLPWQRVAVHLPDEHTYLKLRTSRNRPLITEAEQARFRNGSIAIAGLSVGFSVLQQLVLAGGPRHLRIGDPDHLSIPNLNRLPHSICEIGLRKIDLAQRRVYELDPFADVTAFDDGATLDELREFLAPEGRPADVVFDEMDQFHMKLAIRLAARELGVAVVMVSDVGDTAKVDVERFDLEPDRPILHGRLPDAVVQSVTPSLSREERVRIATAIISPQDMPPRLQRGFEQIGTELPSYPQLGPTAALAGAAGSYVARRIITGADMPSGQYTLSFHAAFDPGWDDPAAVSARAADTARFETRIGLRGAE